MATGIQAYHQVACHIDLIAGIRFIALALDEGADAAVVATDNQRAIGIACTVAARGEIDIELRAAAGDGVGTIPGRLRVNIVRQAKRTQDQIAAHVVSGAEGNGVGDDDAARLSLAHVGVSAIEHAV